MCSTGVGSRLAVLALVFGLLPIAGCGLTLDYSPPDDAGFDGARDGSTSSCATGCGAGQVCANGECRQACTTASDCSDDSLCEKCEAGACLPAPTDLCLPDGCFQSTCDPALDACGAPVDICAASGLACVDGSCQEIPCTTPEDCADFRDPNDCPFLCNDVSRQCQAVGICAEPPIGGCRSFDPCTCSVSDVPDPARCPGERPLCDPATFECVACLGNTDCPSLSQPFCDPLRGVCAACLDSETCAAGLLCDGSTGLCVECAADADCDVGVCDPVEHRCVGCVGDANCDVGVCDPSRSECVECVVDGNCPLDAAFCEVATGTCHGCSTDSQCASGACSGGTCLPPSCDGGVSCPVFDCAHSPTCAGGACSYALDDTMCDDGIACTRDRCDPALARDTTGCVHVPDDGAACDDGLACTEDVCGLSGCAHVPHDDRCRSGSGSLACAIQVCSGGEVGALADPITGCGLTYTSCPPGQVCATSGDCTAAPSCSARMPCPDDGNLCNGVLVCRTDGVCIPSAMTSPCGSTRTCGTYCSVDGCAPRMNDGGGLCVDPMTP